MKKKILSVLTLALMVVSVALSLSSCYLLNGMSGTDGGDGAQQTPAGDIIYNVEGGDSFNVTVNSASQNVAAAGKAVLSVVSVYCQFEERQYTWGGISSGTKTTRSAGSGVIYKLDKERGSAYIVTNYHVVYNAASITQNKISNNINVYLYGSERSDSAIKAEYIGGSMRYDLAVLKVSGSQVLMKSPAVAADVADSDEISILDTVIAIGNPEGEGISATVGSVNVDSENIVISMQDGNYINEIQLRVMRTDAAVNSGNSGGGLFNDRGQLVGIVNAKNASSNVDNIGYAIPSNVAKSIADNIIFYCDNTDKENVYRCILGITVTASSGYAEYDQTTGKVHKREVVSISEITKDSAAEELFKVGDVIESITVDSGTSLVTRTFHVVDTMLDARPGSVIVFTIIRDGQRMDLVINITDDLLTAY